jgi:hypothetical protein
MVDRVYKGDIPRLKQVLEGLRKNFSRLDSKTDWVRLRIDPLLKHAGYLQRLLESKQHSRDFSRLTKGVALFHSDLVYLRTNVKSLEKILETEEKSLRRGVKRK